MAELPSAIFAPLPRVVRWFVAVFVVKLVSPIVAKFAFRAPTEFECILAFHTVCAAVAAPTYRAATSRL